MSSVSRQFGSSSGVKRTILPEWELIWENEDPTASFAAQIISLNLAKYGWVKVEAWVRTTNPELLIVDIPVEEEADNEGGLFQFTSLTDTADAAGAIYSYSRKIAATPTGISVTDCSRRRLNTTSDSVNSTQNAQIIPTRIWGKTTASSVGGDASFRDSGAGMRLLWTNPDPDAEFAAQTISIDLSDYDAVYIITGPTSGDSNYASSIVPIGLGYSFRLISNNGSNIRYYRRNATVTSSGVQFGDGVYNQQGSSTANTSNTTNIPKVIYGVKFG